MKEALKAGVWLDHPHRICVTEKVRKWIGAEAEKEATGISKPIGKCRSTLWSHLITTRSSRVGSHMTTLHHQWGYRSGRGKLGNRNAASQVTGWMAHGSLNFPSRCHNRNDGLWGKLGFSQGSKCMSSAENLKCKKRMARQGWGGGVRKESCPQENSSPKMRECWGSGGMSRRWTGTSKTLPQKTD